MLREAQIPFLLWLPAALIFHLAGGGSAVEAARVMNGQADILAFARTVRSDVRSTLRISVEILGEEAEALEPEKKEEPPPEDDESENEDDEAEKPAEKRVVPPPKRPFVPPKPLAEKPPEPKPEEKKPEPKPEEKKPEPPKLVEKKEEKKPEEKKEPEKTEKPQQIELPKPDGRIAVINDPSIDKDQKDNPDAHRIADHANTVKEESMARFRSYDQNTSKPTGGGEQEPTDATTPGNADQNERGFSHEVPGESDPHAGSEKGPTETDDTPIARSQTGSNEPAGGGQTAREADAGEKAQEAGSGEASPSVVGTDGGSWSISPDAEGDGKPKQKGRKGRKATAARAGIAGVPGVGLAPRYSINAYGLQEALGKEHLRREQERARNTRIAKHRGKFKTNEFSKYRAAIENYDPTVKPGNQTSLNAAKVPFASYINGMHNRIHPIFADGFLNGLSALPPGDKLADLNLVAHTEIVLDGETGAVVRAGIVKTSGVTAFDAAAISSIYSAGPYGKPPEVILSTDGNVYLHWEFYRNPFYACTSKFAHPYIVNVPKEKATPTPQKPSGGGGKEKKKGSDKPLRPEKKSKD